MLHKAHIMKKLKLFILTFTLSCSALVFAQAQGEDLKEAFPVITKLHLDTNKSSFVIEGTSSLHDWEMNSESFSGDISYTKTDTDFNLKSIAVKVGVRSLKSGKNIMDKKCYAALKDETHPNIKYQFQKIKSIKKINDNLSNAILVGALTIAGKTKTVEIAVKITQKEGVVIIEGEKPLKMSDFDVVPPTAILGTLKTGNEITIVFNLNYLTS